MMKFVLIARSLLAFSLLLASQVFAQEGREIARNTFPSVVLIVADHSRSQRGSLGSGFFVEDNLIITNYHVIKGFPRIRIKLVGGSNTYSVQVLATNSTMDLALLKVLGTRATPLTLAELNDVEVGDRIYAIGNPEGLEATLSNGIISGIRQVGGRRYIQISAPISHGSSGGPILNTFGEVIAVAVGALKSGQNLNFAIPVSEVAALRDQFAGTPRTPANSAAKSSTPISRRPQLPSKSRDSLNEALQLVERQPNSADARVKLANMYLEFYFYEGLSVEAAIKEYKRAIQLNPRLPGAYFGLAESYIKAIPPSRSYQQRNELREAAINLYKQAIRINPDHVDAHLGLGNALCDLDRSDEGIAIIRLAISLDPKNPKAYRDLGMALRFSQRSDEAIEAFKKASALDRLPGYYFSLIADVYKETNDMRKPFISIKRLLA